MKRSSDECNREYYTSDSDDDLVLSGTLYTKLNLENIYKHFQVNSTFCKIALDFFTSRPVTHIAKYTKKYNTEETSEIFVENPDNYSQNIKLTIKIKTNNDTIYICLRNSDNFDIIASGNQPDRTLLKHIMDTFLEYLHKHNNQSFYCV